MEDYNIFADLPTGNEATRPFYITVLVDGKDNIRRKHCDIIHRYISTTNEGKQFHPKNLLLI